MRTSHQDRTICDHKEEREKRECEQVIENERERMGASISAQCEEEQRQGKESANAPPSRQEKPRLLFFCFFDNAPSKK